MMDTQVPGDYYLKHDYDDISRFISYFYQVDLVKELNVKTVLEIGIGNKTTSNYLKQHGYSVTTCDHNKDVNPDFTADIIEMPFKDNQYDAVLAYEILEHIPWENFDTAINEMHRVSNKYAIVSIPYAGADIEILMKFPFIYKIFKRRFLSIFLRIPYFFLKMPQGGQHYWEIGRAGYPMRKIRKHIENRFKIIKEVRPAFNSYHQFFVLEKR